MERILFVHLTEDPDAGERLLAALRGVDAGRFSPLVLLASGGPLHTACRELGAEVEIRPLCACFVNACETKPMSGFLLRPGVMLQLGRYCGFIRALIRERKVQAVSAVTGRSRVMASLAGWLAGTSVKQPDAFAKEPAAANQLGEARVA